MKLNLACGNKLMEDYVNVDISPLYNPDIVANVNALPVEDGVADEVLAVHIIEHFYKWEVQPLLKEWRRVLKPNGQLIIECPDLSKVLMNMAIGRGERYDQMVMWPLYGNPDLKDPLQCHKWGYTGESLMSELSRAGFSKSWQEPAIYHLREKRDLRVVSVK